MNQIPNIWMDCPSSQVIVTAYIPLSGELLCTNLYSGVMYHEAPSLQANILLKPNNFGFLKSIQL